MIFSLSCLPMDVLFVSLPMSAPSMVQTHLLVVLNGVLKEVFHLV